LLIPFALLAGAQWRTMIAAGLTVIALAGATTLAFGPEIWWAFAASTETARKLLLEQGGVGFEKLQSVFAAIRLWGGGISLAYAVQGTASLIAIGGVAWLWRSSGDRNLKAALLMVATLLGSPHVLDYDLTIVGPAMAFMIASIDASGGVLDYEISLMAVAWITPLAARGIAGASGLPIGLITIAALYGVVLRRATETRTGSVIVATGIAQA
jgi:hypothetical protein